MYSMIQVFESGMYSISSVKVESDTYFRAKEVATFHGYKDTKKATQDHVSVKYKISYRDLLTSMGGETATVSISDLNSIYQECMSLYSAVSYHKPNSSENGYLSLFYLPPEQLDPTSYPKPSTTKSY